MDESTLLSIKEFSDFTGINQSTLRYYDEIGLFPPALRGENNYRYYTPFQIIKLNYINVLVELGVPLSTIKDMERNRTPESVNELLIQLEDKLDYKLNELRIEYSIIHSYRKNIQKGLTVHDGLIREEEMPDTRFVLGHLNEFGFKNHITFYEEFIRFCRAADGHRINLRYPVGGYHDDMNSFLKVSNRPDKFFSADPMGNSICPQGSYLVGYKQNYYGDFGDFPQKMVDYAQEHELIFKGPVYIVYLLDEISMIEPSQYLSRISVNVLPKKYGRVHKNK